MDILYPLENPRSPNPNFTIDPAIVALIYPIPPDVIGTATNSTRTFLAALNSDKSVYFSVDSGVTWFNSKPDNRLVNTFPSYSGQYFEVPYPNLRYFYVDETGTAFYTEFFYTQTNNAQLAQLSGHIRGLIIG